MQSSAPTSDAIEVPPAASIPAPTPAPTTSATSSSPSPTPSLTFSSLLSPSSTSSSSLTGTIGSSSTPAQLSGSISPMDSTSSSSSSSTSSSIPLTLPFDPRALLEQLKARKLHRHFRPLPSFADFRAFSRPSNSAEAWSRLELNLAWFWLNYAVVGVLVATLAILSQPSLLLTLLLLGCVWLFALSRESIAVPGVRGLVLVGKTKMWTLYALSAVVLVLFAGSTIVMVVGLVGTLVCAHAVLHATPTQEERDAEEQMEAMTMA